VATFADGSVWIDYFSRRLTPTTAQLGELWRDGRLSMGDLIAAEILRGIRQDARERRIRRLLLATEPAAMGSTAVVLQAADFYRTLRARGITVRSHIDCLIATFCIRGGHTLLHSDHDFDPFEEHFGLRVLHPA
jgi:predicted nucleic acid-binding protein